MKQIRLVIFDCDGVMFDTTDVNRAYYNRVLSEFNKPDMTDEQFDYIHMHTADESMAYLFPEKDEFYAAQNFREKMGYDEFLRHMEIEPHLISLLKNLKPKYKTAIATNRSDTMPKVLEEFRLKDYFDLVITSLDVDTPKPHPQGLNKILRHFDMSPSQAIYIGDTKIDEIASKGAGIPFVAYDNPALDADYHIKNLGDVKKILNAYGS